MGIGKNGNTVAWVFRLLALFIIVKAWIYMIHAPIWGPVDELAHMDYIEKLSARNKLPDGDDEIEPVLFNSLSRTQNMLPPNFDGTRKTMGIGNLSYEGQQPPVYYLVLSIPNKIMLAMGIDILQRVKTLRIISLLLLTMGYLLIIPVSRLLFSFRPFKGGSWFGDLCLLFCVLVGFNNKYGLGNDVLSPLINHLSVLCLLAYVKHSTWKFGILAAVFASLAFLTKYTNVVFSLAMLSGIVYVHWRRNKKFWTKELICLVLPFFMIPLYAVYKYMIISPFGWKEYQMSTNLFKAMLPAGMVDFQTFLKVLFNDMFDLGFLGWKKDLSVFIFLSVIWLNLVILLFKFGRLAKQFKWLLFSIIILGALTGMMFLLNRFVAGVHWFAFRHYMGYCICWFLLFFGCIPILLSKRSDG